MVEDVTPHDIAAERAVLGGVLLTPLGLDDVSEVITAQDFFRQPHQWIYAAFLELSANPSTIDPLTISERLQRKGQLEEAGGKGYIYNLMEGVPRSTNVVGYAQIVKEAAERRGLIAVANRILADAKTSEENSRGVLEKAERLIFDLSQRRTKGDFIDGQELARRGFASLERLMEQKTGVTGVPSGFADLDEITRGLQPGSLVLLAGRPSMGKTSLALNLAFNAAERGQRTGFYSIEMSHDELFLRLVAAVARVDSHRLQSGHMNQSDYGKMSHAIGKIAESAIHVDDSPVLTLMELRGKARRLKARAGLSLIVVDYLQLMQLPKAENRNVAVAEVSRGLKLIARELDVPVLALSQLSRDTERRGGDKKPMLSDLRDSGALEQDADLVMFIHRPEVYEQNRPELAGLAELIIAKQRNGPTGTVKLHWHKEQTRFDNRVSA